MGPFGPSCFIYLDPTKKLKIKNSPRKFVGPVFTGPYFAQFCLKNTEIRPKKGEISSFFAKNTHFQPNLAQYCRFFQKIRDFIE